MNYLKIDEKTFLVTGVANKKSVAYFCAKILKENGAKLIFTVQSEEHLPKVEKLFPEEDIYILDVENEQAIKDFGKMFEQKGIKLDGLLHSIAFANYSEGIKPFHETVLKDYLQAVAISSFSLSAISGAVKNCFNPEASVVTISISNTRATSYGYMGPIKAGLMRQWRFSQKAFQVFQKFASMQFVRGHSKHLRRPAFRVISIITCLPKN